MEYRLKNHMEDIVGKAVDHYMAQNDMCRCEKCRMDAMALALNRLPPAYVVTETGDLFARIESTYVQNQVDVEIAVLKAIEMVSNSPRHQ